MLVPAVVEVQLQYLLALVDAETWQHCLMTAETQMSVALPAVVLGFYQL